MPCRVNFRPGNRFYGKHSMGNRMLCIGEARQGEARITFHFPQLPVSIVPQCSHWMCDGWRPARRCPRRTLRNATLGIGGASTASIRLVLLVFWPPPVVA